MKSWWKSKTLWFNLIAAAAAAGEASFDVVQPYIPGNVYAYLSLILVIGNAVLRIITTTQLGNEKGP